MYHHHSILFPSRVRSPRFIILHQLDDGHLGIVTLPGHGPQHACVPSFPVAVPLWGSLEEGVYEILVVHPAEGLTACMKIATLAKLDHVVNVLPDGLGPNEGGLNPSVPNDLGGEGAEESLALIRRFSQLGNFFAVAHHRHIPTGLASDARRFGHGSTREAGLG